MSQKWVKATGITILLFLVYFVIFHPQHVKYEGEDENWFVQINAKLVGLNGSYNIKIQYKGNKAIDIIEYNIHPHYQSGYISLDEKGSYYWECEQDCGYYDNENELLFFVVWKENGSVEEKMKLLTLKKV